MPVQPTYPGVYIEELPSGVRTIVGVATSIAAFVGRTRRGPVEDPTDIASYDAFVRTFGSLWADSALGYAVRDFFLNGGGRAVIVRLHKGATAATILAGGLTFQAASAGTWGAELRVDVSLDPADIDSALAQRLNTTLFTLRVRDAGPGGLSETFRNLSVDDNHRNATRVLENESLLVRFPAPAAAVTPTQGVDPVSKLETELADLRKPGTVPDPAKIKAKQDELRAEVDKARAAVSDGAELTAADIVGLGTGRGLNALDTVDLFNLLCIPPHTVADGTGADVESALVDAAATYCAERRAMLIVDPPRAWTTAAKAKAGFQADPDQMGGRSAGRNAAVFFPRLRRPDPERGGAVMDFAPCGAVAGVFARTDSARGVWKAPAGLEATLAGVPALSVKLADPEIGSLNPLGVNCLRAFPAAGRVVWGSRTLEGSDILASDWKYIPVRRLALFIEESLYRGTQWVVFEPNDEPLWAQIRLNVGAFMQDLFRQGAFAGVSPRDAFAVRCDRETTTDLDQQRGVVNIVVQFAPLRPAEFVVIRLQQLAGQTEA